ncbi:MAG: hypothetical protein K0U29_01885 [Gammaproteobacteria bacterium]|nr:hypothetical protein [Gammaproteobacteria bacterium]MCH9743660.1 hypothetical protein [Gammaproteobacteria bacterium]
MRPEMRDQFDKLDLKTLLGKFFIITHPTSKRRSPNPNHELPDIFIDYLVGRSDEGLELLWFYAWESTALILKLIGKHPDVVSIKHRATGQTLMHIALLEDRLDVAKILMTAKADVAIANKDGALPIEYLPCCSFVPSSETTELTQYLARGATKEAINYAMLNAIVEGKAPWMDTLVAECGADVNACDREGNTALMLTAKANFIACSDSGGKEKLITREMVFKYLKGLGADMNATTEKVGSLLHVWAGMADIHSLVVYLPHFDKSLFKVEDALGRTPLCIAAESRSIGVIGLLRKYGAKLVANSEGKMPQAFVFMPKYDEEGAKQSQKVIDYLGGWRIELDFEAASGSDVPVSARERFLGRRHRASVTVNSSDVVSADSPSPSGR